MEPNVVLVKITRPSLGGRSRSQVTTGEVGRWGGGGEEKGRGGKERCGELIGRMRQRRMLSSQQLQLSLRLTAAEGLGSTPESIGLAGPDLVPHQSVAEVTGVSGRTSELRAGSHNVTILWGLQDVTAGD